MSRERAPAMQQKRPPLLERIKQKIIGGTPMKLGEKREDYGARVKQKYGRALRLFERKPHQGPKECARRAAQLKSGAIRNYNRDYHYLT